ncbi:MAG: acylneuraminate cytidylyltransferase family protein [Gammaproteobacteria bacterium]|nr:acylneuraminate cytidylyltransferase family protein [Gammaproteobacteria bacterium]
MDNKKHIAFVFARGGSKGVRDKNIRPVAGKPLLAHSIESALASRYIERVIVSTDSENISTVAREYGAEVLARPVELAGDKTPELLAWKHAIESCRDRLDDSATFISLPATSPLRIPEDIDAAIEEFQRGRCDILFGITRSHRNPFLNMVTITDARLLEVVNAGSNAVRRQDVPEVFDVTTCVYVGNPEYIMSCEKLMQGRVGYIEIPVERSLDIDSEYDLYLADLVLAHPFEPGAE